MDQYDVEQQTQQREVHGHAEESRGHDDAPLALDVAHEPAQKLTEDERIPVTAELVGPPSLEEDNRSVPQLLADLQRFADAL